MTDLEMRRLDSEKSECASPFEDSQDNCGDSDAFVKKTEQGIDEAASLQFTFRYIVTIISICLVLAVNIHRILRGENAKTMFSLLTRICVLFSIQLALGACDR